MAALTGWPKTVDFAQDQLQLTFATSADFGEWLGNERAFWSQFANGVAANFTGPLTGNINVLNPVANSKTDEVIRNFASTYRTSQGSLGQFIIRIPGNVARCIAFAEVQTPGSTGMQQNEDQLQGRSLARFFTTLGDAALLTGNIRQALADVQLIREGDKSFIQRLDALMKKVEDDWENKIKGFEAKVALNAPRAFWASRADHHRAAATEDRKKLFRSTLALVAFVAVAGFAEFVWPLPPDPIKAAVSGVTRLVLFGTILAISAWWLKQKLKDLRMHEHLGEDAAERATMIETYAAMRGAGLQGTDLKPILDALYRPAIAGLSDDMGPMLPTELMVRGLVAAAAKEK